MRAKTSGCYCQTCIAAETRKYRIAGVSAIAVTIIISVTIITFILTKFL